MNADDKVWAFVDSFKSCIITTESTQNRLPMKLILLILAMWGGESGREYYGAAGSSAIIRFCPAAYNIVLLPAIL